MFQLAQKYKKHDGFSLLCTETTATQETALSLAFDADFNILTLVSVEFAVIVPHSTHGARLADLQFHHRSMTSPRHYGIHYLEIVS